MALALQNDCKQTLARSRVWIVADSEWLVHERSALNFRAARLAPEYSDFYSGAYVVATAAHLTMQSCNTKPAEVRLS
jgi:hypothetical protein